MSNYEDYQSEEKAIMAIPNEEVKNLNMPVGIYLQEAEDLFHTGLKDKAKLIGAGLTEELILSIPVRAGACRYAQSKWNEEMNTREDAQQDWKERYPQAYELRNGLLHTYRYAFGDEPEALTVVNRIAEGYGHADMIQDLSDLALLGQKYAPLLKLINHDGKEVENAATTSDEMADLLARANGETMDSKETKKIRDRAYTHLKIAVDKVRSCGKYLFWKDEEHLRKYTSAYYRKQSSRKPKEAHQEAQQG